MNSPHPITSPLRVLSLPRNRNPSTGSSAYGWSFFSRQISSMYSANRTFRVFGPAFPSTGTRLRALWYSSIASFVCFFVSGVTAPSIGPS